jgi:integrase
VLGPLQVRCGIVRADGKPKYALHAFRHFFASWLIDQGFGPKRVHALMGHASITHDMTFDVYGHLFPAEDDHTKFAAGELAIIG